MLVLGIAISLVMLILFILVISGKIYYLIYSDYTLGLLFPYPSYRIIVIVVTIIMSLILYLAIRLIAKLRKSIR